MKKRTIVLFIVINAIRIFADQSADINLKDDRTITYRTDITFIFSYYLPNQSGVSRNNFSFPTFSILDYTDKNDTHHKSENIGRKVGNDFGAIKAAIYTLQTINIPLKISNNFLFLSSGIGLNFMLNLTPVSINAGSEIKFTPLSFLVLSGGFTFGSGWNIPNLANGLARNNYNGELLDKPERILNEDNFYGAVFNGWFSAKLQFDLSYLVPKTFKRWTHFVFQITPKIIYTGLLSKDFYNGAYEWEANLGETLNGWNFTGEYIVGYQIPVIIDERKTLAEKKHFMGRVKHNDFKISLLFMVETGMSVTHYNDSKMSQNGWGSDFINVSFGPNILFNLPSNFYLLIGTNFANGKKYTEDSVGEAYFKNYKYEDWYIKYNRIALVFGYFF